MCNAKQSNYVCSRLSDYDDLCARTSERYRLKGFYRAFLSTSTQWLANLFNGVCMNAKIINMHVNISSSFSLKLFSLLRNKFYTRHLKISSNEEHH